MPSLKKTHISPTKAEDLAITEAALLDSDTFQPTEENLQRLASQPAFKVRVRGRPQGSGKKEQLTVRFDKEVIAQFRAMGVGWQTRMNDVLKEWLAKNHRG